MRNFSFATYFFVFTTVLLMNSCVLFYDYAELAPAEIPNVHNQAEDFEAAGNYKKAAKAYGKLAMNHNNKEEKAIFFAKQARCLLLANKINAAKESYEKLLKSYPLYISYEDTVENLRQLAACFEQGKGTFLGMKDEAAAASIYEQIVRESPSIHVSLNDRLKLAELLKKTKNTEEAANTYQAILRKDPMQHEVRFELAKLLERFSRKGDGDGRKLRAAIREINTFLQSVDENHPKRKSAERLLRKAKDTQARKFLEQAKFYLQRRHRRPDAARRYLLDIERNFPDTKAAEEAKKILAEQFPENSVEK